MASVAQAVREFDEEVRAPWRPPLDRGRRAVAPTGLRLVREPVGVRAAAAAPAVVGRAPATPGAPARRSTARPRSGGRTELRPGAAPTCPACRSASHREPAPLRLTRRARRLLAVLAVGLVVSLAGATGVLDGLGEGELRLVGESRVVVEPGDTLWDIAVSVAGDEDVRAVVDEIQRRNGLSGADLTPGQVLLLP